MFWMLISPALAWNHTGWGFVEPVLWHRFEGTLPGISEDDWSSAIEDAWQVWQEPMGECGGFEEEYGGTTDWSGGEAHVFAPFDYSGYLTTGVHAVSLIQFSSEVSFTIGERNYYGVSQTSTSLNNNSSWILAEDIADCTDEYVLESFLLHEIGHILGMAHSCEEGEECSELERASMMYWKIPSCTVLTLNADDTDGIRTLYGPHGGVTIESGSSGSGTSEGYFSYDPVELCLSTGIESVEEASWDFGDGTTSTELTPCHTWSDLGESTITLDYLSSEAGCDWRSGGSMTVGVCQALAAPFTVQDLGGGVLQLENLSEQSSCFEGASWSVWDEEVSKVWSSEDWSPVMTITSPGTYRIDLTLIGLQSSRVTSETTVTFTEESLIPVSEGGQDSGETSDEGACGCASAGGGGGLFGLIGLIGLSRRRRS